MGGVAAAQPALLRVLFVLDGTGPAIAENRISALRAAARPLAPFLRDIPVLAAPLADLLHHGLPHPCGAPSTTPTMTTRAVPQ